MTGILSEPITARAAGWPDYAKDLTLGSAVTGSIKIGDYNGTIENITSISDSYKYYWNVYRFSMPKDGLLNIYIESGDSQYLTYSSSSSISYNGFAIFSASNPDGVIWRSRYNENKIEKTYSSAREMYYGSTEISLEEGTYYFAVRQKKTLDAPYYLTLSYKEPVIHVTSISFDKPKIKMEAETRQEIHSTVLPDNATDKTLMWKSTAPSVAAVENGMIEAVSAGAASIIATSSDGETSAVCEVTVTAPPEHYEYRVLEDGSAEISKYDAEDKDVSIPSLIDNRAVTSIGDFAFQNRGSLESVDLPERLKVVGRYSFQNCGSLVGVRLPENVSSVGDYAFQNCGSLAGVELPKGMSFIGNCAFQNCAGLKSVELPEGLTVIGRSSFSSCGIESVGLPESLTSIGDYAFYGCGNLSEAEISQNVESIGQSAFSKCADDLTLIVDKNSYAENYAKSNKIKYKFTDGSSPDDGSSGNNNPPASCAHFYKKSVIPATTKANGSITVICGKCGDEKSKTVIYAAGNVSISKTSYTYNGKTKKLSVTVKDSRGKALKNNTDYTVSFSKGMKNVGRYIVTVTLKGNYSGTITRAFDIVPKGTSIYKVTAKKKGFTVKWKKQADQTTGYEVQYSTSSKFSKKSTKTMDAGKSRATSKAVSKLKAKKKYYVRIRTYKTVKINGKSVKLYSVWSKAKTVMTKK